MADDHTYPQDWGTGLSEQVDWVDAGAFAHLADHPNLRGYVEHGFGFTADWANNILNVGDGKAFVFETGTQTNDHRDEDGPDAKDLIGGTFVVQRDVSGDLALTDSDMNYVYLSVDQTDNDATAYYTNTTQTRPSEPALLLGRVDTANDVIYEMNRNPQTSSRRQRVTGTTHGDSYE